MKIRNLAIANFKAIDQVYLQDLEDVVVIAGPNGCGKSTIFDAIRFWKTNIGASQRDELRQWLSELGFSEARDSLLSAHQNKEEPFSIRAEVEISPRERSFLLEKADFLLSLYYYRQSTQSGIPGPPISAMQNLDLLDDYRNRKAQISQQVSASMQSFLSIPTDNRLIGSVEVSTSGSVGVQSPLALQVMLSVNIPHELGLIDYHGPQRSFARENINSLNLQIDDQIAHNKSQSALYNYSQKYANIKSELASSYIKRLIRENAGERPTSKDGLEATITELFGLFIPGKSFEGIRPTRDGTLTFNVLTPVSNHDIGDLSSGEKELIYGYLRLKSSRLRDSIVLIDEPELHLNPRLTDGLPDFYYRHLGKPENNQLWLVTHSDNVLRQSVDLDGFKVFHMQSLGTFDNSNEQLVEINAQGALNRAVIDLVGDLAGYRPGGKLVILEGGGDTDFDLHLITRLFPEFAQRVNLVSSGSKDRVRNLHNVLDHISRTSALFSEIFSIGDRDSGEEEDRSADNRYQWNSYHIENYLLNSHFILLVLQDNFAADDRTTENDVLAMLRMAAESTKEQLVRHEVEQHAYLTMKRNLSVSTPRNQLFDPDVVSDSVQLSLTRMKRIAIDELSKDALRLRATTYREELDDALATGQWLSRFRGRDVLKAFAAQINRRTLGYEPLRNQILAKMRAANYQPIEIGQTLAKVEPALSRSVH